MAKLPSYRKHSSGQARVTINGRAYYLGRFGSKSSKQRYDSLIAEWLASGRSPSFGVTAAELTLAEVMVGYLAHCKSHYGEKGSEHVATKHLLRLVAKLYSDLPAASFGPQQFKAIRETMVTNPACLRTKKSTGKQVEQLSRPYINSVMKRLTRMFRWAASEGLVPADIYAALRLIPSLKRGRTQAAEPARVLPVDVEVVKATLPHCTPVLAAMIQTQLLVGCRPAELCNLTPAMFDRTGEVWEAKLPEHKTSHHGRERTLYFGPAAQAIVAPYLLRGPDEKLFSPAESDAQRRAIKREQRKTPLNQGNRAGYSDRTRGGRKSKRAPGTSYDTQSYGHAIRYACQRAGVPSWAPNQLRHTAGTAIRKEYGLEGAQVTLGHSSADITQTYAERDAARAIEIARNDAQRKIS